eukprot:6118116-Prorocentrum_lima.AAC.1
MQNNALPVGSYVCVCQRCVGPVALPDPRVDLERPTQNSGPRSPQAVPQLLSLRLSASLSLTLSP